MSTDPFEVGLQELYQGEIIGEVVFDALLAEFDEPSQHYKLATVLQLETETKARLRPAMMELGLNVAEDDESRVAGKHLATLVKGMEWKDAMAVLRDAVEPYLARYQTIADNAPTDYQALAQSMVVHEVSVYDFLAMESAGKTENSLNSIIEQLASPLRI